MNRVAFFFVLAVVYSLFCTPCSAAKFNKKLDVGDEAPAWSELPGVDDKAHSLADLKEAKVVVVAFTCNHCPVAVAYEDRFIEFAKKYKDKGVEFVAINVNTIKADRLDKMKIRADAKGFNFSYLYDESQEIGQKYGATVTPHLFVLTKDRKIGYMGAFDDKMQSDEVEHHYVVDAVDALLEGKTPEVTESRQFGCGIQYE